MSLLTPPHHLKQHPGVEEIILTQSPMKISQEKLSHYILQLICLGELRWARYSGGSPEAGQEVADLLPFCSRQGQVEQCHQLDACLLPEKVHILAWQTSWTW